MSEAVKCDAPRCSRSIRKDQTGETTWLEVSLPDWPKNELAAGFRDGPYHFCNAADLLKFLDRRTAELIRVTEAVEAESA